MEMHTTSYWLTLPEEFIQQLEYPRAVVVDGLRGLGQTLETVAALALMCDPKDLSQTMGEGELGTQAKIDNSAPEQIGQLDPTLFVFDAHPGGVGLAARIFERSDELLDRCRELLTSCPCPAGCPACVGPSDGSLRKAVSLKILEQLEKNKPIIH